MKGLDLQIEKRKQSSGISYIETVIEFAEARQVDFEDIVKELHPSVIDKLKVEYIKLNMVKGQKIDTSIENFLD